MGTLVCPVSVNLNSHTQTPSINWVAQPPSAVLKLLRRCMASLRWPVLYFESKKDMVRILSRSMVLVLTICLVLLQSVGFSKTGNQTQKQDLKQPTRLVGRVLAGVQSLAFGAGLGPSYTTFIFGVQKNGAILPVKVSYAFFNSQGPPPDSFFDHSKLYELQASRDPHCDELLSSVAQTKNIDESGKLLPPSQSLRILDGAPKKVLKADLILPCYVLYAGRYKLLSQHSKAAPAPKQ